MASSSSSAAAAAVGRAVEEVRSALNEHADVVAELFGRVSTELRGGFAPAVDTFDGFFHAVDWKVRVRLLLSPSFYRSCGFIIPCLACISLDSAIPRCI
jgi:hypothetical protein